MLPAGWDCLTNGPVTGRPPAGQAGTWRFGPVSGTRPFDLTIAAGPYVQAWRGEGGTGGAVRMSIRRRRSLDGAAPGLDRFAGLARQALETTSCWSRSSGRDLAGWAQEWLRTEGASTLRASVQAGPDGTSGRWRWSRTSRGRTGSASGCTACPGPALPGRCCGGGG